MTTNKEKNVQGTLLSEEFERTVPLDDYVFYFLARTFHTFSEGFAKTPIRKAIYKHRVAGYAFLAKKHELFLNQKTRLPKKNVSRKTCDASLASPIHGRSLKNGTSCQEKELKAKIPNVNATR